MELGELGEGVPQLAADGTDYYARGGLECYAPEVIES